MKKYFNFESTPYVYQEQIKDATYSYLYVSGYFMESQYGHTTPEIFRYDGKTGKSYCHKFKTRSFKFIFKALKAIAQYINDMPGNELISPERLFWAKVHELIKYDDIPKETLKLFGTGMNGSLKVYIK